MIKRQSRRIGFELERNPGFLDAGLQHLNYSLLTSVVPEMHDYSQSGCYVASASNNISNPVYNAFNTDESYADLGEFNEVKEIALNLNKSVSISAIGVEFQGNVGAIGVELSVSSDGQVWKSVGAWCVGVSESSQYSNFLAIDGNFANLSQGITNAKGVLVVRNLLSSRRFKLSFSPYSSSSSLFLVKSILLSDSNVVNYFNEKLNNSFLYEHQSFDASFAQVLGRNCLRFGDGASSFGYLLYPSSILYNLESFALFFGFCVFSNNEKNYLASKSLNAFGLYVESGSLWLEWLGATREIKEVSYDAWHTVALAYQNNSIKVYLDGFLVFEVARKVDFTECYGKPLCIGAFEQDNLEKEHSLNGAVSSVNIFSDSCNDFLINQFHQLFMAERL